MRGSKSVSPTRTSVSAGAAIVSQYISRGVAFSEHDSLQTYIRLDLAAPELAVGPLTDASAFVGTWNSMQNGGPGLGQPHSGNFAGWYETDLYLGAKFKLHKYWTVQAAYYRYESPADSFDGYNDVELIVSFDGAPFWDERTSLENFSLSPSLRLAQEFARPGRTDSLYVQPSLTIGFDLGHPDRALHVSVPLVAGFSDNYFPDANGAAQRFGFFRTGLAMSGAPFASAPNLQLHGGFDLWLLNSRVANGLDDTEVVGQVGASWRH